MKASSKAIFVVLLVFITAAVYVLVLTHHLKINFVLDTSGGQQRGGDAGLVAPTDFFKYDLNKDGKLDWEEFKVLLAQHYGSLGKVGAKWLTFNSSAASAAARSQQQQAVVTVAKLQRAEQQGGGVAAAVPEAVKEVKKVKEATKVPKKVVAVVPTSVPPPASPAKPQQELKPKPGDKSGEKAVVKVASGSGCEELSPELLRQFARDNTVMLTVSDWRIFETFGINWMKTMALIGA